MFFHCILGEIKSSIQLSYRFWWKIVSASVIFSNARLMTISLLKKWSLKCLFLFFTFHKFVNILILVNGCVVVNWHIPANIDLFKVNKRNTRKMYEIYSKLTMKAQKRCRLILYYLKIPENQRFFSVLRGYKMGWGRSVVFIKNFNIFHTFDYSFYSRNWTGRYLMFVGM